MLPSGGLKSGSMKKMSGSNGAERDVGRVVVRDFRRRRRIHAVGGEDRRRRDFPRDGRSPCGRRQCEYTNQARLALVIADGIIIRGPAHTGQELSTKRCYPSRPIYLRVRPSGRKEGVDMRLGGSPKRLNEAMACARRGAGGEQAATGSSSAATSRPRGLAAPRLIVADSAGLTWVLEGHAAAGRPSTLRRSLREWLVRRFRSRRTTPPDLEGLRPLRPSARKVLCISSSGNLHAWKFSPWIRRRRGSHHPDTAPRLARSSVAKRTVRRIGQLWEASAATLGGPHGDRVGRFPRCCPSGGVVAYRCYASADGG